MAISNFVIQSAEWKFAGKSPMPSADDDDDELAQLSLYEVLGVGASCADAELRRAYRREALRWHPDKCRLASPAAAEARFKRISHAWYVLSDAQRRAAYDADEGYSGASCPCSDAREWDAVWRACAEEDARARAAQARNERAFLARTLASAAWVVAACAALWAAAADSPLLFPPPLRLSNRALGNEVPMRTPFRNFTRHLVAARTAELRPLSAALSPLLRVHTGYLELAFNASDVRESGLHPVPGAAILLGAPRKVGAKVHTVYTLVRAPHAVDRRWWLARRALCIRLFASGTAASRARWFETVSDDLGGRLRPFVLEAAPDDECALGLGLPAVGGVLGAGIGLGAASVRLMRRARLLGGPDDDAG